MDASEQGALARMVQNHVPRQPWSWWGNDPVPVEITFTASGTDPARPWAVKFVAGLKGGKRQWAWAHGATLTDALVDARHTQLASALPRVDPGGDPGDQ